MLSNAARGATQADIVARGISPEAEQATARRHP
jgi:hypothetical protein